MWREIVQAVLTEDEFNKVYFPPPVETEILIDLEASLEITLSEHLRSLFEECDGIYVESPFKGRGGIFDDYPWLPFIFSVSDIKKINRTYRNHFNARPFNTPLDRLLFFAEGGDAGFYAHPVTVGGIVRGDVFKWPTYGMLIKVAPLLQTFIEDWFSDRIRSWWRHPEDNP